MIKVTELTYSTKDFKDILRTVTPIQDDTKKMDLDPFPSTADLAIFANKAYSDKDDELCSSLPEGWELLTTAHNSTGYFGCLYFNPSRQQVVLAHRGTKLSSPGAVGTDIKGVCLNLNTEYMFSAITLGDKIKCAILDLNQPKDGVHLTLTITGHSLGGWISQVTAITVKHLKWFNNKFVSNIDNGIHAHTVAFDSPGVQHMAIKILWEHLSVDFDYSIFLHLDISNVFFAVNYVNTTGYHVGSMYQIFSEFIKVYKTDCMKPFFKHGIKNFIDAFRDNMKVLRVKGWPRGKREIDLGTTIKWHRFSEAEIDFVKLLRMVKRNKISNSVIDKFFDAKSFQPFPNFEMDRKEKTVILDSELNSKQFFKNIKNAVRWFSVELLVVMEKQEKLTLPDFLLDWISQECQDSIVVLPDCEDPLGLCEFTNNTNTVRVLYVQGADCSLEMARIYSLCKAYPDININECIFLNCESLLRLKKHLTTKGLPLDNNYNLFVINIGSTTEIALVQEFLTNVFSKFKEYSKKKAVIVSQINPDLFNFVNSIEPELVIRCWPLSKEECLEFTFNDLKDTSRRELFSKEFIILGEQAMSLNTLLGENCQSSVSIDDVMKPLLKDMLTKENFILNIPNNSLKFDQLDVMFSKINREVNMDSLTEVLREETCSLFVSSDVRQMLELQLQEVPGAAERVLDVSGSNEEDFRQACLENSSIHIAYWFAATDGRIFLKEVYNCSFYLPRHFHKQSVVDLTKLVQKKNDVDLFVFVGVADKATLMRYLKASPEVEKLFSTNLVFKCFQNLITAENAEGIDRCVNKHTLEVVKEGEGYLLVWRGSQGALYSLLPCLSTHGRLLSEEELCALKTVIISDLPGMGKSTTLTSLSRHLVNSWLFRINLRDRPADIMNLPAQMSVESVAHFLVGASSEPATLSLLRFCLQSQNSRQIHVLLDGFDEIRDEEAVEKILKLCHFLKNETTAKIIVTTRDSYKDVLVNRLSTVATKFKEITEEIQLNFLVDFWHSHALLGQKEERLRRFAQHLYKAAYEKLGGHIIELIGIPLHTRMLAEAFLLQVKEFIDNAEPLPDIIGINNIYSLYNKFTSVKCEIYLKEKISLASNVIDSLGNMLTEVLTVNHCVLAFEILDPGFKKKYLPMDKIYHDEMNRFGLTRWKRENHCDFIHRTFAEYFCSQLLVLWLRQENFRYANLRIKEWFLSNLLINKDFKVVRKFMDEHLAEVILTEESKQLLYNNMSKCWSKDAEAFRNKDGETALHVAVKEGNTNIIDLLLGGLAKEQTREPFESFLVARDYNGNTALNMGLKTLIPLHCIYVFGSNLPIENGIKQILNITHLIDELQYKLLLCSFFEGDFLSFYSELLLKCALNEKYQEDIQSALNHIKVLQSKVFSKNWYEQKPQKNFILNDQNNIVERKFLLLAGIDGETAVNIESSAGNYEVVKQFIQINHDVVNSRDRQRMTPLLCAAKGGHIELVKFLHQQGARLNDHHCRGRTALSFAAESGNLDVVKYLLEYGADYKLSDVFSTTPLHYAIEGGRMAIVKYLISEIKVNVNCLDKGGKTPLHYAMWEGHEEIVKYLISEVKVNINCLDKDGMTPLICAIKGGLVEIVKYLIKVDINCLDNEGKTLLHHAIKGGYKKMVEYLISEVKVDINCVDEDGKTPLYYAIKRGREEIVKYLISEVKVDIKCSDKDGMTPLHYAAEEGHEEMVKYLISEGTVDINCLHKNGKTPLHYAIELENWKTAECLLKAGANPNILDHDGKTPLDYVTDADWLNRLKSIKTPSGDPIT